LRFGIRFKLLLVSLSLIAIPVAGYRFIQEMETFLRQAQDQNLNTSAQALTLLLRNSDQIPSTHTPENRLYAHPSHPVILDGYADDWQELLPLAQSFSPSGSMPFRVLLSESPRYIYLLLLVEGRLPSYIQGANIEYAESDQVVLRLADTNGQQRGYLVAPRAPGSITPRRLENHQPGSLDFRLQGEWQEVSNGYNLEMRIPRQLTDGGLSIQVLNSQLSYASRTNTDNPPLTLIRPSSDLELMLSKLSLPNARIWITDRHGWIIARSGTLLTDALPDNSNTPWLLRKLLNMFLQHQGGESTPIPENSIRIQTKLLASALEGTVATRRYHQANSETLVISSAHPVAINNQIRGAVVLEQTTAAILSLQNQAMQRLLLITFTLFIVVALALLGFASLLTSRIRRLHQQMEQAVAPDGRIIGEISTKGSGDEIEELKQGFSSVLIRLQEYNRYLQAMASRLSHEFRTPLTIIRTSLENSEQVHTSEEKQAYLQRALNGVDRLELILRQLQEATRLEKTLENIEVQELDLCQLLSFSLDSYASIHPKIEFSLHPCNRCLITGSPELIHQALEKLLDNAIDFHLPQTTIRVKLKKHRNQAYICVTNQGPLPPANLDLFQSLISVRQDEREQPHLGLGLYLVKLIAEFHRGNTQMKSDISTQSVEFCFSISVAKQVN
jgi:dedicated sortase system histidine kinase